MKLFQILCATFVLFFLSSSPALAESDQLIRPADSVILTVTGNITQTNAEGRALFDRKMLEALPQHSITTKTPWTEGLHTYEGVSLTELLDYLGAAGQQIKAVALDDFSAMISIDDIKKYSALLAMRKDGSPMRVRHKGPFWIILPLDQYPEIDNVVYHDRMVWQLTRIEVK